MRIITVKKKLCSCYRLSKAPRYTNSGRDVSVLKALKKENNFPPIVGDNIVQTTGL